MTGTDTLVIGLGSIGQRHVRVLQAMGRKVATVSRRDGGSFPDITGALLQSQPDYVVIATETTRHGEDIARLANAGYGGIVLVEKPLLASVSALRLGAIGRLCVGYNLRFHPVIVRLRQVLAEDKTIAANAYVGQHLSQWRPGRDLRSTSSALRASGGGVLRDLSHEFDLLQWLLGNWRSVAANVGNSRTLDIDVEDHADVMLDLERCSSASVSMNALDRTSTRVLRFVQNERTVVADLVAGTLQIGDRSETFTTTRDDSFTAMHRAVLEGEEAACTLEEGLEVVRLIEACEAAAKSKRWIER